MKEAVAFAVGIIFVVAIVLSSLYNKNDLKRLQELKNRRRFGGKRLPIEQQKELDDLSKKYWWY